MTKHMGRDEQSSLIEICVKAREQEAYKTESWFCFLTQSKSALCNSVQH